MPPDHSHFPSLNVETAAPQDESLSAQDLRLLLDHAPDAIARFDRELRHVYVNDATAIANARSKQDFSGRTMEELGHSAEVCAFINNNLRAVFASGQELTEELLFEGPFGPVWFQCRMSPEFSSDGEVEYVLVISRNISAQRAAEQATRIAEKRAYAAELTANLAHEIHNPLTSVVNAVYLLSKNQSLDSDARSLIELTANELKRLSEISKRLLIAQWPGEHPPS